MAPNDTPTTGPMCLENCTKCLSNAIIKNESVINTNNGDTSSSDGSIQKSITNMSGTNVAAATVVTAQQDTIKTINGKFFMVNGANISCACVRSPNGFSKYCHLGDGYIDLVLVRHTSFINNIRFLLAMSSQNSNIVSIAMSIQFIDETLHYFIVIVIIIKLRIIYFPDGVAAR